MATIKKPAKKERPIDAVQSTEGEFLTRIVNGVETVLTVSGKPIPVAFAHAIPYGKTDQGIAEDNEGKEVPRVQMVRDEWQQMLAKRSDANVPVWASPDPMAETVDKHRKPGMAYKFLSPAHVAKKGMRHYESVVDSRGDVVKVGDLVLGEIPLEMRNARNAYYQKQGNDELAAVEEAYRTNQERALLDAGISRDMASVLRAGDEVHDYDNPERQATIGVRSQRGEPL